MVHILETLQRIETKFDSLSVSSSTTPSSWRESATGERAPMPSSGSGRARTESEPQTDAQPDFDPYFSTKDMHQSYYHLTAAHKVILWPSIYLHITNKNFAIAEDLQYILQDGTPWLTHLELQKHPAPLPGPSNVHSIVASPEPQSTIAIKTFAGLPLETIQRLIDAYFSTFNVIHPILDQDVFVAEVVNPLVQNGYEDGDAHACLCLSVLALGKVAIDGVHGSPISVSASGEPSGIRGGTLERPPGLDIFNEARRLIGFSMNQCNLENVQIYLLQAYVPPHIRRWLDYANTFQAHITKRVHVIW